MDKKVDYTITRRIREAADKANSYTKEFRRLREKCPRYKWDSEWKQNGCKTAGHFNICNPIVCPFRS